MNVGEMNRTRKSLKGSCHILNILQKRGKRSRDIKCKYSKPSLPSKSLRKLVLCKNDQKNRIKVK